MKATDFWPERTFWDRRVLFFETSDEIPPVDLVRFMLRNYGMQDIFQRISALLFGRARGYSDEAKRRLDQVTTDVVAGEFGCSTLPIVTNMDCGHTDPQTILPLGVMTEVDPQARQIRLVEPVFRE